MMPKGKGAKQKDEAAAIKDGEGYKTIWIITRASF
jgi:hypothetical protein